MGQPTGEDSSTLQVYRSSKHEIRPVIRPMSNQGSTAREQLQLRIKGGPHKSAMTGARRAHSARTEVDGVGVRGAVASADNLLRRAQESLGDHRVFDC